MTRIPDLQTLFDRTLEHLRAQGTAAKGPNPHPHTLNTCPTICAYRAPNGHTCAVGCHIPPDLYDPKMEGLNVTELFAAFPQVAELFPDHPQTLDLLVDLQELHDTWLSLDSLEARAASIAYGFELTYHA